MSETFYKTLLQVRLNAQLRQLVRKIEEARSDYLLASHHADDFTTDGRNWQQLRRSAFLRMQGAGDRIVELATDFFQ